MMPQQFRRPNNGLGPIKVIPFEIGSQHFAVAVRDVRDVLPPQPITHIHPTPQEIVGLMNLRGRIVTALDLRARFGLAPVAEGDRAYGVVVEHSGEVYCLLVDRIGDVMALAPGDRVLNLRSINSRVRDVAAGAYQCRDGVRVVIDLERLFRLILRRRQ
jgi:purine-binding chemotaxis protein CheW